LLMNYRDILSRFNKGGTIPLYAMREQVLVPKYILLVSAENNKKFLDDGQIALSSEKENSKVTIKFSNFPRETMVTDGKTTYLWMKIENLSKKEFIFVPSKHVKIQRDSDKQLARLIRYKDLLDKQIKGEQVSQTLVGVSAVLSAAAGNYDNTHSLQSAEFSRRGREQRKFLKQLIKPTTLKSKSSDPTVSYLLSGLIAFQSPKLPDDKVHLYSIKVKAGDDIHLFNYKQRKVKIKKPAPARPTKRRHY